MVRLVKALPMYMYTGVCIKYVLLSWFLYTVVIIIHVFPVIVGSMINPLPRPVIRERVCI